MKPLISDDQLSKLF